MKRFLRPAVFTLLAIAIVLGGIVLASSRYPRPATFGGGDPVYVSRPPIEYMKIAAPRSAALQGVPAPAPNRDIAQSTADVTPATQIARTGFVSLLVFNVDKAVSAVSRLASLENGDVLSLEDKGRAETGGPPSASMEVRVPENRFESAMQLLGSIGTVRSRSITAEDLTSQIVDSSARLRNLRRTELDIMKIMDRSGSVAQILDAENQLSSVREQIETMDAGVKSMRNRVRYSTISVSLVAETSTAPSEPTALAQLVSARRSAVHAVVQFTIGLAASILWIAAFIPYFLLAAVAIWFLRKRLMALRRA